MEAMARGALAVATPVAGIPELVADGETGFLAAEPSAPAVADAVERALEERECVSEHERWLVAGAGRDWPTAQEAVLKLREGVHVAAEAHHTEQLLHGDLAAVDEGVRAFVLEGEGRAAERARQAVAALRELGAQATLVPTVHPVVDIVRFQQLTVDLAEARGVDPDRIRRDEERWARAREAYE
jgi:fructoselysine-6-P-deglycase FrlB-like protein